MKKLQLTVGIIKPDLYCRPKALKHVRSLIKDSKNLYIVRSEELQWTLGNAQQFYREHKRRFFFGRLVTYMSSGPMMPLIMAGPDAIQTWRNMLGPTKSYTARVRAPDTIRGMYGITDTRNSVHGADSEASVAKEIAFLFPDFDMARWFEEDEPYFRTGNVKYCSINHVHFNDH